jgi:hypothetical protein
MAVRTATKGSQTPFATVSNLNSLANTEAKPLGKVTAVASSQVPLNYRMNLEIALASTGVSATGVLEIYLIESEDDSDYTDGIDPAGTTNIAASLKNAKLIDVLLANANSQIVRAVIDLIGAGFPPVMDVPNFWTIVVKNLSGAALASSGHDCDFTKVTETIA